jgi:hypothetical protein
MGWVNFTFRISEGWAPGRRRWGSASPGNGETRIKGPEAQPGPSRRQKSDPPGRGSSSFNSKDLEREIPISGAISRAISRSPLPKHLGSLDTLPAEYEPAGTENGGTPLGILVPGGPIHSSLM